ncbi:MAG: D-alanyl-D-alanine carboxypeptidase family protein [Firmicutes bacterium]|nr:D-alanyl-D-alanine carboxypeptidase family protein [Bacillota bacterium]
MQKKYSLKNTTYIDNNNKTIVKNTNSILVLINKERNLPSDYKPKDLVIPNIRFPFKEDLPKKKLRKVAATSLEKMFNGADKKGIYLFGASGYRSYNRQKVLFDSYSKRYGKKAANKFSAKPGQSEHQTGLVMDVTSQSVGFRLKEKFGQTKEGKWIKKNAHEYGFIVRYPKGKEDITGYQYEPWHIRYVGKEVAENIYENNITLEEFFS